jgi:hypothetical protein
LFLVKDGEAELWVAALVDEDVWTYVVNTGKSHRNEGARHDYYFLNEMEYVEIGIAEAQRLIRAGVGRVDEVEFADSVRRSVGGLESLHSTGHIGAGAGPDLCHSPTPAIGHAEPTAEPEPGR